MIKYIVDRPNISVAHVEANNVSINYNGDLIFYVDNGFNNYKIKKAFASGRWKEFWEEEND